MNTGTTESHREGVTVRDSLVDRVRKLRALAESARKLDNVHEAAAAARAADELIQKHRLEEAELEIGGEESEAPSEDATPFVTFGRNRVLWQATLASFLVHHYGCSMYWTNQRVVKSDRLGAFVGSICIGKIIGRRSDVEIARYMNAWLSVEIARLLGKSGMCGKDERNSFCVGAVAAVIEKMRAAKRVVVGTSAAMVKLDSRFDEATTAMEVLHPKLKKDHSRMRMSDEGAFFAGKRAGSTIEIETKSRLDGGSVKKLGGG